jgi:hypothetical protein
MAEETPLRFWSVLLFKVSSLLLALLLGLQLAGKSFGVNVDVTLFYSWEQFVFAYVTLIVTLLAFVEGRTLQLRVPQGTLPVVMLYIVAGIGAYFSGLILLAKYDFSSGGTNTWFGYYLLFGVFMILINARDVIFSRLKK